MAVPPSLFFMEDALERWICPILKCTFGQVWSKLVGQVNIIQKYRPVINNASLECLAQSCCDLILVWFRLQNKFNTEM